MGVPRRLRPRVAAFALLDLQNAPVSSVPAVFLVVGIAALGVSSAIAFVVVVLWALRRASRDRAAEMRASFPEAELGPELGQYRGGTGPYPRARNTSWIVLIPTALVVRPILGTPVTLPVADISGVRIEKSFKGHWNGQPVLVVETARGEIGLTIASPDTWRAALVR